MIPFSSRFAFDDEQLPPPEPEEDDGRGHQRDLHDLEEETSESQQRLHKVKSSMPKSAQRRLGRRRQKIQTQPVVVEQDRGEYQRNVICDFQAQSSEERKKRALDDIPLSLRRGVEDATASTSPLPSAEAPDDQNENDEERDQGRDDETRQEEDHRDKRPGHGPYYIYSFLFWKM